MEEQDQVADIINGLSSNMDNDTSCNKKKSM